MAVNLPAITLWMKKSLEVAARACAGMEYGLWGH
jgi:hypothetical protein